MLEGVTTEDTEGTEDTEDTEGEARSGYHRYRR